MSPEEPELPRSRHLESFEMQKNSKVNPPFPAVDLPDHLSIGFDVGERTNGESSTIENSNASSNDGSFNGGSSNGSSSIGGKSRLCLSAYFT